MNRESGTEKNIDESQGGPRGLELVVAYGLLGEKKWGVNGFKVNEFTSRFTDIDRVVVRELAHIADGELSGAAMMFCLYEACKGNQNGFADFYEPLLYSANTIVYEEFRHGLIVKEMLAAIDGAPSFISDSSGSELAEKYLKIESIWNNPFEVLVSFLMGEITNIILYREASRRATSKELKEILNNISKDEYRHKTAWRDMCKKIVAQSKDGVPRFLDAFERCHYKHQAEIGRYYLDGFMATKHYFTKEVAIEIFREKMEILREVVGPENVSFSASDLIDTQLKYLEGLESLKK